MTTVSSLRQTFSNLETDVTNAENNFSVYRSDLQIWKEGDPDNLLGNRNLLRAQIENAKKAFRSFIESIPNELVLQDYDFSRMDNLRYRINNIEKGFKPLDTDPLHARDQSETSQCRKRSREILILCAFTVILIANVFVPRTMS